MVLASNFCRFESPTGNQQLFAKTHSALKPGGIFMVNNFVPNEERTEPTFALRFSVYTLTHTPEGECWTLAQYSDWMKAIRRNERQGAARCARIQIRLPIAIGGDCLGGHAWSEERRVSLRSTHPTG